MTGGWPALSADSVGARRLSRAPRSAMPQPNRRRNDVGCGARRGREGTLRPQGAPAYETCIWTRGLYPLGVATWNVVACAATRHGMEVPCTTRGLEGYLATDVGVLGSSRPQTALGAWAWTHERRSRQLRDGPRGPKAVWESLLSSRRGRRSGPCLPGSGAAHDLGRRQPRHGQPRAPFWSTSRTPATSRVC